MCGDPSGPEVPWHELIEVLVGVAASEALEGVVRDGEGRLGTEVGGVLARPWLRIASSPLGKSYQRQPAPVAHPQATVRHLAA
jgi:hypothetical protein